MEGLIRQLLTLPQLQELTAVDAGCGIFLHFIGNVGVDIQRGLGGDMANDGGQRLHIHAVFQ